MLIYSSNYIQDGPIDTKVVAIHKCMEELLQIVHERRKYDKQLLKYVTQVNTMYMYYILVIHHDTVLLTLFY